MFFYTLLICAMLAVAQASVLKSCDIYDADELFDYINATAKANEVQITENIQNAVGPHLGVGIVIPYRSSKKNSSTYALAINEYYARRNGYALKIVDDDLNDDNVGDFRITWNAVKYLREALSTWAKKLDYVLFMESDLITLDMSLRLEQLASKHKKSNIMFIAGGVVTSTKVGSDWILVKNNEWTMDLLDDWWNYRDRTTMSDVDVFEDYHKMHEEEISDYITIVNINTMKTEYPAMSKLWKHNQFLQFPLEVSEYKKIVFEDAFDTVCDAVKENPLEEEYPKQLGVTKEKLLALSAEVYRELWQARYDAFEAKAEAGENTYGENQHLMTLSYHLAYTLDTMNSPEGDAAPTSSPEATRVRGKSFKQMYLNLKRYRTKISKGAETAKKLAEKDVSFTPLLKVVLKTGQDFVSRMPENFKDKKVVIKIVRDILDDLLEIKENDPEIQEALVNMNVDMGMINMNEHKYQAALADFLAGLRIARKVGAIIGDQVVLAPASQAADAMVLLERYEEAVVLYLHVVQLATKHHGDEDLTTAFIKVQAAMANEYYKKYKKANKLIEGALEIFHLHPQESVPANIYQVARQIQERTMNRKDEEYEKDL